MCAIFAIMLVASQMPATEVSTPLPGTPLIYEDLCVFEYGCEYTRAWVVLDTLAAYANRGDSTVAFTLLPGDSVTFVRGDLVVERFGKLLIDSAESGYAPGDTVYVTYCDSEGWCSTWAKGRPGAIEAFWCGPTDWGRLLEPRKETWWVKFGKANATSGWLRLDNTEECGFVFLEKLEIHSKWGDWR